MNSLVKGIVTRRKLDPQNPKVGVVRAGKLLFVALVYFPGR